MTKNKKQRTVIKAAKLSAYKKLMTAKAKQNSLDEQIDYIKSKLIAADSSISSSLQLSAFKKELTYYEKSKG